MKTRDWPLRVANSYGDTEIQCDFQMERVSRFHPDWKYHESCGYSLGVMPSSFTLGDLETSLERHIPVFHPETEEK